MLMIIHQSFGIDEPLIANYRPVLEDEEDESRFCVSVAM